MWKFETRKLSEIKLGSNIREHDPAYIDELTASIKKYGLLQPLLVDPLMNLVAGFGRYAVLSKLGKTEVPVCVTDENLTASQMMILQLQENERRRQLTDWERYQAYYQIAQLNPGWTGKELAEAVVETPSTITRTLSLSRGIPEVRDAVREGRIGISAAYEICKMGENAVAEQREMLHAKLHGATRDEVAARVRRKKADKIEAVRSTRCRCELASGVCVTLTGSALSLDEVVEALVEASKAAKKALAEGLDARTWQRVMADRSKAAGVQP